MRLLIATAICLMAAEPAVAADWHIFGAGGRKPDRSFAFVDVASLQKAGSMTRAWVRWVWENPAEGANGQVNLLAIKCEDKTYRTLKTTYYAGERPVREGKPDPSEDYAPPGSVIAHVIMEICTSSYSQTRVADPVALTQRAWAKD